MPTPPASPRAIAFVDGQNLFHGARHAFGYRWPNYDVRKLVDRICSDRGWTVTQIRFCTGVPDAADNAFWNHFWTHKLAQMGRTGVHVYSRSLRYRNESIRLPDGTEHTALVGREKGIDVRLALDLLTLAIDGAYDVGLVFSQDQDLSEAVEDVKRIARTSGRWVRLASAFPYSPTLINKRGIDRTDWIRIDKATYDAAIDRRDYRPKRKP